MLALTPSRLESYSSPPQPTVSKYGGTLFWGTVNEPTLINPILTSHSISSALMGLVFDSLVRMDQHGRIVPGLAKAWHVSPDGLVYTFHLRQRVYFHDGVELTAQDVKFTYDCILDARNGSHWRSMLDLIQDIAVLDPYTLRVRLKQPGNNFLARMVREIVPKHLYAGQNLSQHPHNHAPVGTGPFRFQSWDRVTHEITLHANPHYFEGRPYLDRIVVRTYRDNVALWAAIMRGDVDFVNYINYEDYQVLRRDQSFQAVEVSHGLYYAIAYDLKDPLLSNVKLRQALDMAVDRKALMMLTGLQGVESNGPFYPGTPWFNNEVEKPRYDPRAARTLLSALGWNENPVSGLLEKGGAPLMLAILVDRSNDFYLKMAKILRQQFAEVGIGLKVISYSDVSQLTPDFLTKAKPQMWLRMFLQSPSAPWYSMEDWYSKSSVHGRPWVYKNEVLDRLIEQGVGGKDAKSLAPLYQKIHTVIHKDQPACFLFFQVTYHAVSSKIGGTENYLLYESMPDYLLKEWFFKPERREPHGNHQPRYQ